VPGYLTSMAVLIEADNWLEQVETALNAKDIFTRTKLDSAMLNLAHRVRNDYLRFEFSVTSPNTGGSSKGMPPHAKTKIETKVGDGLSQYAFAGALGPDFPSAGNIMALNQRWVGETLHKGSSRRAWRNAHTTEFVLYSPDNIAGVVNVPGNEVFTDLHRLYTTIRVGHLASIAAHVVIQPFINQWAWTNAADLSPVSSVIPWPLTTSTKPGDAVQFSVQLDAKLAQAYFQRDKLHGGQNWAEYLPDDDRAVDFICSLYLEAFSVVYGVDQPSVSPSQGSKLVDSRTMETSPTKPPAAILPRDRACDVPSLADLEKTYQDLKDLIRTYPKLGVKLSHWHGWPVKGFSHFKIYDDIFTDDDKDIPDDDQKKIIAALSAIKGYSDLRSKLRDYPCSTPQLDIDFLRDAYKNTRNWALAAGYQHIPYFFTLIMSAVIGFISSNPVHPPEGATGIVKSILSILGFGVTQNVWGATVGFDASDDVKAENLKEWTDKGINEIMVFDMFDNGYGANGLPFFIFANIFTGFPFTPWWDGLFGKNADVLNGIPFGWRRAFVLFNDVISPIFLFPILFNSKIVSESVVKWYRQWPVRWFFYWVVNVGFDGIEALFICNPDAATGRQGDPLGLRVWYLRLWLTGSFVLSSLLAFGVKAKDPRTNPSPNPDPRDFLLGLVFPLVLIGAIVWGRSGFEGALLQAITGIDWPGNGTEEVDTFISVGEKQIDGQAGKRKFLQDDVGTPQSVALFKQESFEMGDETSADGTMAQYSYYPEAAASTPFNDLSAADEKARREAHVASPNTYRFKQLFDGAAVFAGLLSMALVNYEESSDSKKKSIAASIFKDWNLSYRTESEWNELMETREDKNPGLIKAAQEWWSDLSAKPPRASSAGVVEVLGSAFGLAPEEAAQLG